LCSFLQSPDGDIIDSWWWYHRLYFDT